MAGRNLKVDQSVKGGEAMRILLGEADGVMGEDGFEGSKGEREIFMNVFYGTSTDGTMNLQTDEGRHMKGSVGLNCETSVLTSYSSMKDPSTETEAFIHAKVDYKRTPFFDCFPGNSSSWVRSDAQNVNGKQGILSSLEHLNHKKGEPRFSYTDDLVQFDMSEGSPGESMQNLLPCRIVESFGRGILSSYCLFNSQGEMNGAGDTDNGVVLHSKCADQHTGGDKLVMGVKSMTSPASQESFSSGLLLTGGSATPKEIPATLECMDQTPQEFGILNSDTVDVASRRAFIRDLPSRLHSQAHCLLLDAGWKIEPRKRSDRTKLASSFIAPEGVSFRALSQAWRTCGESLLSDASRSQRDEEREWMDIGVFWNDLAITLSYIEETGHPKDSLSLLDRWKILDPFMAVVWIDKRIGALREGRGLRAMRSATFFLRDRKNMILVDKGMDRVEGGHLIKPYFCSLDSSSLSMNSTFDPDSKSEVFEGSCNQQVLAAQGVQQLQKKHRCRQIDGNLCSCGEIHTKKLKTLARRMGKGLYNTEHLHIMNCKASASQCKRTDGSSGKSTFKMNDSCSLYPVASPLDDYSPQDSATLGSEKLIFQAPKSVEFTIMNRNIGSNIQECGVAPGLNDQLLVGNESCKETSCKETNFDQQMPLHCLKEEMFCEESNGYCQEGAQDKFVHVIMSDAVRGIHLWPEMQSLANQSSVIKGVPAFGRDSDILCDLDFSNHGEFSAVHQEDHTIAEKAAGIGAFEHELEQASTEKLVNGSIKKARKKSKRISEIEATEVCGKSLRAKLHDGKSRCIFGFSMADRVSDHLDLLFRQEEDNIFRWQTTPECIEQSNYLEKQCNNVTEASETEKAYNSVVAEASSMTKKYVKLEIKATRQNGKDNKSNLNMLLEDEPGDTLLNLDSAQEYIANHKAKKMISSKSTSMSLSQIKKRSRPKKVPRHCMDAKEKVVVDDGSIPTELHNEGSNGVLGQAIGVSPDTWNSRKNSKVKKSEIHVENGRKRPHGCRIDDDDLLIAAILKNKDFSGAKHFASKVGASQSKAFRKLKSQKGSCKLVLRTPGKGGRHSMDGTRFVLGVKTVLCWLIEMGALSLKDTVQFRNLKNNEVVKDGWITRDGILCKCCTNILSVSDFKAHAGFKLHKPTLNLFLQSGKPYTLCQLQAWSAEYKARKGHMRVMKIKELDQNDDTCGLCGDGGELICCDNCPSTYHQECLPSQELPEGSWYCSNCVCEVCGGVVNRKEASSSLAMLECSQCEHKYHDSCIKEKVSCNGEVVSDAWFCGESCQEVYLGLRSSVGVLNNIGDGFSWTILRCSHDDQKVRSAQKIAAMADCNTKLAIALTIMEECFLPMVDPRTGIDMIPHVLYNWGSNFARFNYQGFYTVVLEKGDELISVASIRLHGVTVAEMPLVATCSEYRRQGMCRRLMNAIEKLLKSFKVKMLVLSAIPNLVDTWTSGFGFKPIEDDDKQQLKNINLMMFPGTSFLKKNLCEATAQESGPTSRSSPSNTEGNSDFCSTEDQSKTFGGSDENIFKSGQQSAGNSIIDLDAESLLPINMNLPLEPVNCQQSNLLVSSCESALVAGHSKPGDVNNAESCYVPIRTSNLYEMDQFFSTEQAVATKMSVTNIYTAVRSCSDSLTPTRNNELPNIPSSTQTLAIIGYDKEENLSQNINILTEDSGVDVTKEERNASVEDVEVENKEETLML